MIGGNIIIQWIIKCFLFFSNDRNNIKNHIHTSALDERDFDILAMIYHLPIYIVYNYNRKTLTGKTLFDSLTLPFYRKALKC